MNESSAPSTPAARRKARRFALQALYGWQLSGNDVREIEVQYLRDNDMHKVDRGYFHDLLFGVVEQVEVLDAALSESLDRAPAELTQVEKAILRIGTFELMSRQDVPVRVVINEGIELAKMFGAEESFKYINGVLDKLARAHRQLELGGR